MGLKRLSRWAFLCSAAAAILAASVLFSGELVDDGATQPTTRSSIADVIGFVCCVAAATTAFSWVRKEGHDVLRATIGAAAAIATSVVLAVALIAVIANR